MRKQSSIIRMTVDELNIYKCPVCEEPVVWTQGAETLDASHHNRDYHATLTPDNDYVVVVIQFLEEPVVEEEEEEE